MIWRNKIGIMVIIVFRAVPVFCWLFSVCSFSSSNFLFPILLHFPFTHLTRIFVIDFPEMIITTVYTFCLYKNIFNFAPAKESFHDIACRKRKKADIWIIPMTKALIPTEMSKGQIDNTKTPPKCPITQRYRTDLGRSVAVTTATQLVWLTGLRTEPSHSPQQQCYQKDTHLKIEDAYGFFNITCHVSDSNWRVRPPR